jgi:probable F420-dependent oxidoreductase
MEIDSLKLPFRMAQRLDRIGLWSMELRYGDAAETTEAAAELDELGYGALWIPGAMDGDLLADTHRLHSGTPRTTIATGILNIWMHDADGVAAWRHQLPEDHRRRSLLGLGVSHGATLGEAYQRPHAAMNQYLDQLHRQGVPGTAMCLPALGPKMLDLARDRTAGAHPT